MLNQVKRNSFVALLVALLILVGGSLGATPVLPTPGASMFRQDFDKTGIMKISFPAMLNYAYQDELRLADLLPWFFADFQGSLITFSDLSVMVTKQEENTRHLVKLFPLYNTVIPEKIPSLESFPPTFPEALKFLAQTLDESAFMYAAILKHPLMGRIEHSHLRNTCADLRDTRGLWASQLRALLPPLSTLEE